MKSRSISPSLAGSSTVVLSPAPSSSGVRASRSGWPLTIRTAFTRPSIGSRCPPACVSVLPTGYKCYAAGSMTADILPTLISINGSGP